MRHRGPRGTARLFAKYAVICLVPVLILGVVLAASLAGEARQRGLSEGRREALLVAQSAVQPLLEPRPITANLSAGETAGLRRLVAAAVRNKKILRLRVRDLAGQVVFSDDGSGFRGKPEDAALTAARGGIVVLLTHLNADSNDTGATGEAAVEVYQPLYADGSGRPVGVLEMYLPYGPIAADVAAGMTRLYLSLAIGLTLLWLALFCDHGVGQPRPAPPGGAERRAGGAVALERGAVPPAVRAQPAADAGLRASDTADRGRQ
jgi:hypothetical protein